jgi:hypothetical protein
VALFVGRDVALVAGSFSLRARDLGWKWRGAAQFFDLRRGGDADGSALSMPTEVRPSLISKANTVLQLGLVASCLSSDWLGWPGAEGIWWLAGATAVTTVWSLGDYAQLALLKKKM